MSGDTLRQDWADRLLAAEKFPSEKGSILQFPAAGSLQQIALRSPGEKEEFHLDVRRARIDLKGTYQTRARGTVVLARLDFGSAPHRNPDGQTVPAPHLHLYREGFGDRWATPLPSNFTDPADIQKTLTEFLDFCHVRKLPVQQGIL